MASLRLDRITKRYDDGTQALQPVSCTVPDGELLVIMGPSGCGKSTLLRIIAGLVEPTEGAVWIGGENATEVEPSKRDVAMVFQDYALYPHMTVAENLAFGLRMRKVPSADRETQVATVADQLGLKPLLSRKPKDLSGGEQQRVALGRALIRRPKLFLLDEPLSNLDASLRGSIRDEIRRLHAETGTTMVYVTHDQQEALSLAQRLIVMQHGAVLQVAPPETIYHEPTSLAVARALGQPPINTVRGRVLRGDGELRLETAAGVLPLPRWAATVELPSEIILGVRPEHVSLLPLSDPESATLAMAIDTLEGAGPDRIAWLSWGQITWATRVPDDTELRAGDTVPAGLALDRVHVFDAGTETAIRPAPGQSPRAETATA